MAERPKFEVCCWTCRSGWGNGRGVVCCRKGRLPYINDFCCEDWLPSKKEVRIKINIYNREKAEETKNETTL